MKNPKNVCKAGVVVGRFQTPYLHPGHIYLLNKAKASRRKLMICVGVSGGVGGCKDPLDFKTRAMMLKAYYPKAIIIPVRDNPCDHAWSKRLDDLIAENLPDYKPILFGSRDGFIPHYKGAHECRVVNANGDHCATDIRKGVADTVIDSVDFRSGIVYAFTNQLHPTSFQTVDIVIKHSTEPKVVVGRKTGEKGWRFPGGFVDPQKDMSLEHAAKREFKEEVGDVEIAGLKYLSSVRVNDHRYRSSEHKIMTALISGTYIFGKIEARDDLEEVRWQNLDDLMECLVEAHKPLGAAYLQTLKNK